MIAAVMSSATAHADAILPRLLDGNRPAKSHLGLIDNLFRLVLESNRRKTLARGMSVVARSVDGRYEDWQYEVVAGLVDAVEYRGGTWRAWYEEQEGDVRRAIESLERLFAAAREDAFNPALPLKHRIAAARLVGRGLQPDDADPRRLADLLVPQTPVELQQVAVSVLDILEPDELSDLLLDQWGQLGPNIRPRVLDMLVRDESGACACLTRSRRATSWPTNSGWPCAANSCSITRHASARRRAAAQSSLPRPTTGSHRAIPKPALGTGRSGTRARSLSTALRFLPSAGR